MNFVFEPLTEQHDLSRFRSGNSMLDSYLRREALKEQRGDLSRIFVVIDAQESPTRPVGFYALKTTSYYVPLLDSLAPSGTHLWPAEIGCLARDLSQRGKGLGGLLVMDALRQVDRASQHIGLPGVFLNATKEGVALYESFGFLRVDASNPDYYLPMSHVRKILQEFDTL